MSAEWVVAICAALTAVFGCVGVFVRMGAQHANVLAEIAAMQAAISTNAQTLTRTKEDIWAAQNRLSDRVNDLEKQIIEMRADMKHWRSKHEQN